MNTCSKHEGEDLVLAAMSEEVGRDEKLVQEEDANARPDLAEEHRLHVSGSGEDIHPRAFGFSRPQPLLQQEQSTEATFVPGEKVLSAPRTARL